MLGGPVLSKLGKAFTATFPAASSLLANVASKKISFGANATTSEALRANVLKNIADSKAARASSNFESYLKNEWPPNNGFIEGSSERYTLWPGQLVDRYGSAQGSFAADFGTSFRARSLKPGSDSLPYRVYEVAQPVEVMAGPSKPWFGYEGNGMQY